MSRGDAPFSGALVKFCIWIFIVSFGQKHISYSVQNVYILRYDVQGLTNIVRT